MRELKLLQHHQSEERGEGERVREGGRKGGGREKGIEGGRERERKGGREREREGEREGERERKGGRKGGRKGRRGREERSKVQHSIIKYNAHTNNEPQGLARTLDLLSSVNYVCPH